MSFDDDVDRALQAVQIQFPIEADRKFDVINRARPFELIQKPQSLLSERNREQIVFRFRHLKRRIDNRIQFIFILC